MNYNYVRSILEAERRNSVPYEKRFDISFSLSMCRFPVT